MKKNYSNPRVKFVLLDTSDIVCTSLGDNEAGYGGDGTGKQMGAKQRDNNIWDE